MEMPNFTDEELEDLLYYQDNETLILIPTMSSVEDLIHEMNETDMIQNLQRKLTKENFDQTNQRSGRSHEVLPEKIRKNGVGTEIISKNFVSSFLFQGQFSGTPIRNF
jgi:hypothetical protein